MKIVVTDGFTLNPGDLRWSALHAFGQLDYFDRTLPADVIPRCQDASIIVTNKTPIGRDVIEKAHRLRFIAVTATGYNMVDIDAARAKKVVVSNVPEYGTHSVAQHAFALLLELSNQVGKHSRSVRDGEWARSIDWTYSLSPIVELKDKVLGIVGLGKIGNQTAAIARAFGMQIVFCGGRSVSGAAREVSMRQLFSNADFISLHCPLKADNQEFVNGSLLSVMKPGAFLINTARGKLIHEEDLAFALKNKTIAGAALDVLGQEPPAADNPLTNLSNCIITPHNAWLSFEARQRILETSIGNIRAFIAGHPINVVGETR